MNKFIDILLDIGFEKRNDIFNGIDVMSSYLYVSEYSDTHGGRYQTHIIIRKNSIDSIVGYSNKINATYKMIEKKRFQYPDECISYIKSINEFNYILRKIKIKKIL